MSSHSLDEPIFDWILLDYYIRIVSLNQALLSIKETALQTGKDICSFHFNQCLLNILYTAIIIQPLHHLKGRSFLSRNKRAQDVYFRSPKLILQNSVLLRMTAWIRDFFFTSFPMMGKITSVRTSGLWRHTSRLNPGLCIFIT
jgi:hypothetical protein